MRGDLGKLDRDLGRRQHHVDHAGRDGCTRHSVELRRLRFLRERDPAGRLDLANTGRAVRCCSGQNDADGAALSVFRQRGEEGVDRRVLRPVAGPWLQIEVAIR